MTSLFYMTYDRWEDLSHIHVDLDSKATLKEFFGYSAVPYYIVFDKVHCYQPKNFHFSFTIYIYRMVRSSNLAIQNLWITPSSVKI